MKKIYLLGFASLFALAANAQQLQKTKLNNRNVKRSEMNSTNAKVASPLQIAGSVVCNTQYVAGSTMDLEFTLNLTNTNSEYGDFISLTFPAGVTPNSSPNNPFASDAADPGPDGPEALNTVSGQTISWGNNDNNWGGIVAPASYNFTVNVTIGSGVSGTIPVTYSVSGDQYVTPSVDISGTANVLPVGAAIVNMQAKLVGVITNTVTFETATANNCSLNTHFIAAQLNNLGNNPESNIPVNYSINGVASTPTTYTGTIAAGDSAIVVFPIPGNFSAQGLYTLKAWSAAAGDVSLTNDTVTLNLSNSLPTPLTSTSYSNGIESSYDVGSLNLDWVGVGLPFGTSTGTKHSGAQALFYTVNMTTVGAPAGTYESFINLPCVDVTSGETYRISYWRKANTSGTLTVNGQSAIFTGTAQSAADMTTVLKAYSAITPNAQAGVWQKDSVDYTATTTETRYFGIGAKGTLATTADQINVRIDDIKIEKVSVTTGIKNVSNDAIAIFPNPTTGILNINAVNANISVEIYNVIGERVYSNNNLNKGNNSIDLSNLSNGSYFVKINDNNEISTKKVILNK